MQASGTDEGGLGLALTVKVDSFRTIRNSSPDSLDSPEGDLGGSGLPLTVKTDGLRSIRNSSLDSPEGDLGGIRAHFDCEHKWCSHNMEFITGFAGFAPIRRIRCQQPQDGTSPTHAQDGQDDVSLNTPQTDFIHRLYVSPRTL